MTNTDNFPSGMKSLGSYGRLQGLSFGSLLDAGYRACDPTSPSPVLGSLGYEAKDAALLQSYNVTYLKYDNCYADGNTTTDNAPKNVRTDFPTRFGAMSKALANVGIKKFAHLPVGRRPASVGRPPHRPSQWTGA